MLSDIITMTSLLLGSILWVEIVRDCYHALSHHWIPLYRLHAWHHRVFRPDLSPVSEEIYRKAHWYNDLPEALVMLTLSLIPGTVFFVESFPYSWMAWGGSIYALTFLIGAITRGAGVPYADELTDITHRQGEFVTLPGNWFVNRPYHWRHHFDNQKAYYSGTLTLVDKLMGTALSLKGKTVAVTGASGTLGQSLLKQLYSNGAIPIAFTTSQSQSIAVEIEGKKLPIKTLTWQVDQELELTDELESVDILILNHGINVHHERTPEAINKSYEVNTFSSLRLMELFITTVKTNKDRVCKEVWVNTSEAEVCPAVSPLYELSKRALGNLVTLRRLDAPCVVRKLILGPFKSNLNPIGLMSGDWVAKQIIKAAKAGNRNIIVTVNPITFILFPLKEFFVFLYFKLFSRKVKII
ncbi:MAG: bifunctional sterol desaturase/short chain dehydrogenase [cyanobacterium endosymbiont of Rhopalodia musculus]|uniref:bifunctional sterol desaturase/short chain dehydrogenase n=1 Tax=cyanobacterium endosymbiont of Epithemia clementina EcSB TaxID=3034674 RepID=UPI0024813C9F|nr:bifunctional sterol desaturase/short chain dehydrogenase [cyanobacterium endosymbiont of Epithemia clementina EcSB]WGT68087.1 bifunctional sterol desaturase/short chain dehydrogenase [cyanobacterium endosymbiont of Epithemia clementina EcSB]